MKPKIFPLLDKWWILFAFNYPGGPGLKVQYFSTEQYAREYLERAYVMNDVFDGVDIIL